MPLVVVRNGCQWLAPQAANGLPWSNQEASSFEVDARSQKASSAETDASKAESSSTEVYFDRGVSGSTPSISLQKTEPSKPFKCSLCTTRVRR